MRVRDGNGDVGTRVVVVVALNGRWSWWWRGIYRINRVIVGEGLRGVWISINGDGDEGGLKYVAGVTMELELNYCTCCVVRLCDEDTLFQLYGYSYVKL